MKTFLHALLPFAFITAMAATDASAQQVHSHLTDITKSHELKVCALTDYYAISYRDPKANKLISLDADMAAALAGSLGANLKMVETSFGTFAADLQANKCDIAMSGFGATLKRAQAVEFSEPYLITDIVAIVRNGGKVSSWDDIDKPGVKVAVLLGSYIEPFIKGYLKNATVMTIQPPASREGELMARRADVVAADFPTALKVRDTFDWATILTPKTKLSVTPFAYAVSPGDQIWLNYVNLFVETMKRNGKLAEAAKAAHLDAILAP
jgi:ABC-type amino acid transport substrate-binding protein